MSTMFGNVSDTSIREPNDYRLKSLDLILDSGDVVSLLDMFASINIHHSEYGSILQRKHKSF